MGREARAEASGAMQVKGKMGEREAKIRSKTARAALRARSKEEATDAQPEHDSHTKAELDKTGAQTSS